MTKNLKGKLTDFITKESYEKLMYKKCRKCGAEVLAEDYYARRTCPNCREICSAGGLKEIHVFFEDSAYENIIHFAGYYKSKKKDFEKGVDYNIYRILGEFDKPKNALRSHSGHFCNESKSLAINDIVKNITPITKIYLWGNAQDANSLLSVLFYAESFKNLNNVYYVKYATTSELKNKKYKITDSLENAIKLKKSDFKKLKKEFEIITEKEGYFVSKNDKISRYDKDFFDEMMLSVISFRYNRAATVQKDFEKLVNDKYGNLSYYQFCAIVDSLCKRGLVEPSSKYDVYSKVYFPKMTLRLANKTKKKATYLEAMNCVSYAFEEGSTFGLYRVLKDDAILKNVSKVIEGRENIIHYIENIVLCFKENNYETPCKCHKRKNENINYLEDVRMYIYYPSTDSYNEVKIQFNDGIIEKILILEDTYLDDNYETYNPFKIELKQIFKNPFKTLDDCELKFYNKTVDEKEVLLVEYLSKEERQEYEMLKSQIDDDKTGEIAYKLSHLLRLAARYQMEKDRPKEPLCQWFMWFQDKPSMKYMEISKDLGYLMGQFEWLEHNEEYRTWEEVFDDYKKLALEKNFAPAAIRLSELYKAKKFFNARTVCPRRDLKRALYWFDKSLELEGIEKDESSYREELIKEIKKENSEKETQPSVYNTKRIKEVKELVNNLCIKEDSCFKYVVRSCVLNRSISLQYLKEKHNLSDERVENILFHMEICNFITLSLNYKDLDVILTPDEYEIIFEECIDN